VEETPVADEDPLKSLIREIILAASMIGILILGLWAHTGSMPPLVVVESSSMIHDIDGEIGSIDAGDLILVHNQPYDSIITFAEASQIGSQYHGYSSHGMEGDVIIYEKNGDAGTPIIHRAILRVNPHDTYSPSRDVDINPSNDDYCPNGGTYDKYTIDEIDGKVGTCVENWDVPGTDQTAVESVTVHFDGTQAGLYDCKRPSHANVESYLVVWQWQPKHAGMLTLGDNNKCSVDQGSSAVNGSSGVHSQSGLVGPVASDWVIGVAGGELPWLGTVKLMVSGGDSPGTVYVPTSSFYWLFTLIASVLIAPMIIEPMINKLMQRSPEVGQANKESKYLVLEEE
jgi:signal peptidase I